MPPFRTRLFPWIERRGNSSAGTSQFQSTSLLMLGLRTAEQSGNVRHDMDFFEVPLPASFQSA